MTKNPPADAATDATSVFPRLFDGRFLHQCPFVGTTIDEHDDEIVHCRCYDSSEFEKLKDARAVAIDARRAISSEKAE